MTSESEQEKNAPTTLKVGEQVQNPYKQPTLPSLTPGMKIGPNKIQLLIGEGGSANVYKVWHEGLEVVRAVKVLKNYTNKESRERFFTEAKILADIHHPNIVEIHNIGYFDQSIPFLEMEYVDGAPIRTLLALHKRLPVSVAVAIAYYVSHALRYTHIKDYTIYGNVYHGLIHRDIKPDNILISTDAIVKLMDFGIARPSEVSLHTIGQKIMGTLIYLSPEQLNGKTLDLRTDIFSLGAVLYEMLTGQRAFPQKVLSELVQKKTKGEFRPIDMYDIPFPEELVAVVNKSMALDPNDRYMNCAEFGHDLFSVFRRISDRAPQDVISQFISNPAGYNDESPVSISKKRDGTGKKFMPLYLVGAAAAGSIAMFAILKLFGIV